MWGVGVCVELGSARDGILYGHAPVAAGCGCVPVLRARLPLMHGLICCAVLHLSRFRLTTI